MAESRNTFIKSKMNQDLDSRLIPNGEYREGLNIAISQSEGSDVGTLKTVLGNAILTDFGFTNDCNVEIIGYCIDDENNSVYLFFSNFIDTSFNKLSNYPSEQAICQIWRRNITTGQNTKLVEGNFLNFSITHPITGANVLEDLLFWTDNRNQPRKININKANPSDSASPTYYVNDDQINVIKYYPSDAISLVNNYIVDYSLSSGTVGDYINYIGDIVPTSGGSGTGMLIEIVNAAGIAGSLTAINIVDEGIGYEDGDVITVAPRIGDATVTISMEVGTTMKDKCTEKLPINSTFSVTPAATLNKNSPITVGSPAGTPTEGPNLTQVDYTNALVKITSSVESPKLAKVTAQTATTLTIDWPNTNPNTLASVTSIEVGINPDYDENWPGDCQYLKDKFVRFAYRFKFDDNEYSIISPFTQACFIPQQNGYFLSTEKEVTGDGVTEDITVTDADLALESTELEFFQNSVTNVELLIPCPKFLDYSVSGFNNLNEQMHVEAIEIIYKSDAENVLKVVDVIEKEDFIDLDSNILKYDYQSRKPIKVLPESEITRVSDKVPLRALSQEIVGNRVMYANYLDGHSSLNSLNYEVNSGPKFNLPENTLRKEYQNHTLKQNRTYQVGIVLSDRYGRQSDVVLSSLDEQASVVSGNTFVGSTIYHPYKPSGWSKEQIVTDGNKTWPGDILNVKFNEVIPETVGIEGYPGLFIGYEAPSLSNLFGGGGYTGPGATGATTSGGSGTGLTVDYTTFKPSGPSYVASVTINNPGTGYESGDIIEIDGGATKATFVYQPTRIPNLNGWYSYKIVVKQQEQDYYNVYLPGVVNGAINTSGIASGTEATISLFADNINKVPRDLNEIAPTQTTFNSSVELSMRVVNNYENEWTSTQFYPNTSLEKVKTLGELSDLGITLRRITKEILTESGATIEYDGFNEDIQQGMSVIIKDPTGVTTSPLTEGLYVTQAFQNASGNPEVILNEAPLFAPAVGDTITFGPPGVVYNSNNNPLLGILSTSTQLGVAEEDGFKLQLAVAETQPFESALDIYYETSSSGLINELNTAIQEGAGTGLEVPFAISTIDTATWDESQTGSFPVTNDFTILDATNSVFTDINATGSLISVTDGDGNPRDGEFQLNNLGTGYFNISTTNAVGEGYAVLSNENLTKFTFNVSLESQGITLYKSVSDSINNVRPSYGGNYNLNSLNPLVIPKWDPFIFPNNYGVGQYEINGNDIFSAVNGSGDAAKETQELRWVLEDAVCVGGENISFDDYIAPCLAAGNSQETCWPSGWQAYPNDSLATSAYVEDPQAGAAYSQYQILKGQSYLGTFAFANVYPNGIGTSTDPTDLDTIWGTNTPWNPDHWDGPTARLCTPFALRKGNTPGSLQAAGGWFEQYPGAFGSSQGALQTANFVNFITFKLTFRVNDRLGSGLIPSTGKVELYVKFQ